MVTRLVSGALAAVALAVVVSATTTARDGQPRARPAADSQNVVAVVDGQPTLARVLSAQRIGDAIVLRADPEGDLAIRNLIVSPAARVSAPAVTGDLTPRRSALPALLRTAADPAGQAALRVLRFTLEYDGAGHVVALTQVS